MSPAAELAVLFKKFDPSTVTFEYVVYKAAPEDMHVLLKKSVSLINTSP